MTERRRVHRSRTFKSGTISIGDASMDCLIRNLSTSGACLELKGTTALPDDFKLGIKPDNLFRSCKVIWREHRRIGVVFS